MEIEGRIILALPEQSGTSKAGNEWKKREYVLETHESYPRKVHFDLFGQKADQYPLNVGDEIRLSFDINSREYNGRWFTSISGWKVEPAGQTQGTPMGQAPQDFPGAAPFPPAPATPDLSADPSDDLPF